jgi:ribosomal protein S18 acetylase RimI-like enzyme
VWSHAGEAPLTEALLRAAAEFVDDCRIPLAQIVVGEEDGYGDAMLARSGFPRFAELAYLFAETSAAGETDHFSGSSPETTDRLSGSSPAALERDAIRQCEGLHFVPRAGDEPLRLAALLEQTYIGTLDCPGLDGVRPMDEVLEGYRAQGRHRPEEWYFVQEAGEDIGALILTEHPGVENWELVYMGLVPRARGRNCGLRIIRFALDTAARHGAQRLVLAVDANNLPALRAYERAGFIAWDRRIVYARLRGGA